jgi:hypothetical protein
MDFPDSASNSSSISYTQILLPIHPGPSNFIPRFDIFLQLREVFLVGHGVPLLTRQSSADAGGSIKRKGRRVTAGDEADG